MEPQNTENEFAKTAQLLNELQRQLIQYKSALDSIDSASSSTQSAANEISRLASVFDKLSQTQSDLLQSFNDTRRALIFTQQKTQQVRKDLDDLSQNFTKTVNGGMQRAVEEIDKKIAAASAVDSSTIRKEVSRLKFFLFANVLVMFVLFFSVVFYFSSQSRPAARQQAPPPVSQSQPPAPAEERAVEPAESSPGSAAGEAVVSKPRIQVLNGCGTSGVAQLFENFLERRNFEVTNTGNADNFSYATSLIFFNGDFEAEAATIATNLGIDLSRVSFGSAKWQDYDITVIVGDDHPNLIPQR